MKRLTIEYYAYFREKRGLSTEEIETESQTLRDLYQESAVEHGFALPVQNVRVIVGDEFREMDDPVEEGSTVVFVPPVAGG